MLTSLSVSVAPFLGIVLSNVLVPRLFLIASRIINVHLHRSIERQMAVHAEAEKEMQSKIDALQHQLQAAHDQADRKQAVVDNLSEVGDMPCFRSFTE